MVRRAGRAGGDALHVSLSRGPCGWLTDPFGLPWQVVPAQLPELMRDPDAARAQRVTQAIMRMGKLGIAELPRAADGG